MKHLFNFYDFLFFSIYKEFKNIYSKKADPLFYSLLAIYLILSILFTPLLILIIEIKLNLFISRPIWFILAGMFMVLNLLYFKKEKVVSIENKFNQNKNRNNYKFALWIFVIISFIFFFKALAIIELNR